MSRKAEEAYEAWMKEQKAEAERDLVIGAKVYRPAYDRIEEGEVCRIDRIRFEQSWAGLPREVEDPNGPHIRYHACFRNQWDSQFYQRRWFCSLDAAHKKLAEELRERAKDLRYKADKWEALAAKFEVPMSQTPTGISPGTTGPE